MVTQEIYKQKEDRPVNKRLSSTPEQQGMSSKKIYALLQHIIDNNLGINSLLIYRNGHLVTEGYFHPFHRDYIHTVHSMAKIITNASMGIAIREGYITDINQKVVDFFPEYTFKNLCEKKKQMTIHNLLCSRTGIEWGDVINREALEDIRVLFEMAKSSDWVQFCLDREMAYAPGEMFNSNSPGGQLAALILQKVTGRTVMDYADEKIFKPLGITNYQWWLSDQGQNTGAQGLSLRPEDLARFGLLYHNKGWWNGVSIIPEEWIERSITPFFETRAHDKNFFLDKFGYMWYISSAIPHRNYSAYGAWGQFLTVIEELNLTIVFTGDLPLDQFKLIVFGMIKDQIVPACVSSGPIPEDNESYDKLTALLETIEYPAVSDFPTLSHHAEKLCCKRYIFDEQNSPLFFPDIFSTYRLQEIRIVFTGNKSCTMDLTFDNYQFSIAVSLNNLYTTTKVNGRFGPMDVSAKGYWENNTFIINYYTNMGRKNTFSITVTEDEGEVECFSDSHVFSGTITAKEKS